MLLPSLPHMLFVCLQWNVIKLYIWLTRRSCATCTAVIRTRPVSSCFTPCLEKGNMRRLHFRHRGMINGLLSGVLHSAFISVFFWKQPAYLLKKKGLWYSKAFSVSQAHIPNGVPGRNEKALLSVWWDPGLNCVCRRRSVGKMCMYLPQLDASSSGCWCFDSSVIAYVDSQGSPVLFKVKLPVRGN